MKSKLLRGVEGEPGRYAFYCPGCEHSHSVFISPHVGGVHWTFNGDFDSPTFSPSLLVDGSRPERRCHSFIENGHIRYLDDCHHGLKGRMVPMEKF